MNKNASCNLGNGFIRNLAFTLAEVLITLGIIGVVAVLTIPTLINNIQDEQYKAAWKKTYSMFANATQKIVSDNGGSIKDIITESDDTMKVLYEENLIVSSKCDDPTSNGKCWHNNGTWTLLNKSAPTDTMAGEIWFIGGTAGNILSDGTLVRYMSFDKCTQHTANNCGYIMVDVNGFKKPNVVGKDIYAMHLTPTKLYPFGSNADGNEDTCTATTNGFGCAAEYLYK